MNKFINLRNGRISAASYRLPECRATTLDDLITCALNGTDDYLTASFDADELCKHPDFLNEFAYELADELADEDFLNELADE